MSVARLESLRRLVAEHDGRLALWLEAGLARWREGEALDRALGLTGSDATLARDAALRRAARALDRYEEAKPWPLAGDLLQAIDWFEAERWPRLRNGRPGELPPLQAALADAFSACATAGVVMLRSQRSLHRALTNSGELVSHEATAPASTATVDPSDTGAAP